MRTPIYFRRGNIVDIPTLAQGEPGFALDTKKLYVGTATGNQGIVSSAPTLATWIVPTLLNSWVNFGAGQAVAGYYKNDLNEVRIKGLIKLGAVTANTIIFVLPVGYRPSASLMVGALTNNGTTTAGIQLFITASGDVGIDTTSAYSTWLNLSDITFRAEQ